MKYFLVNGERITEEQLLAMSEKKPEPPTTAALQDNLPKPTLPKLENGVKELGGWSEKRRLDGVERVKTGKKRKKAYNFIGNKELSLVDYVKYFNWPAPLGRWDYSYLMSHVKTWTLKRVYTSVNREVLTQMAYHFKMYDQPDCYGAPKEWLYNRLVELSRRKRDLKRK
jgi:hypothetical protein